MRHLPALLVALCLVAGSAAAQPTAAPPARAALDRLHLLSEWTTYLPLEGAKDAVGTVQVADDTQIFVQTRAGLLVALDAASGAKQWTFSYPASYSTLYPLAITDEFVFALNVARLYCLHRYTGVLEFDYVLPGYATTGAAADKENVYITLNGNKLIAFRFPMLIRTAAGQPSDTTRPAGEPTNPADALADRYTLGTTRSLLTEPVFDRPIAMWGANEPAGGLSALNRTPSVSLLPSVTPPYTLAGRRLQTAPSLSVVPSLRRPYQFKPDYMRFNQRTPSINVLPPSVARSFELANLRPKGVQPTQEWSYAAAARLRFPPVRVAGTVANAAGVRSVIDRLWFTTDGPVGGAVSAVNGQPQVIATFTATAAAPMAGPLAVVPAGDVARTQLGFVGLVEGALVAVDLFGGSLDGARVEWRANLGGVLNHKPLVTEAAVFASGDHAGVSQVDARTGQVIWATAPTADFPLAVNDEFVYVRDRLGNLLVYDRRAAPDPVTRRAEPLARMGLPGFTVPVTNHQTDRILLAGDNGVMICLRDEAAKYVRPKLVAPPPAPPPAKKEPGAAPPEEPKKEAPKVEPKKVEPKVQPKKVEPKKVAPKKE
ncbi:MAG TPA: PQQ-binding-like beta-propeller repeat protein [Fimbriiglobus sp.]|nr:PQQ-binding-like beta-propeller repeat protein [Fimbriiglobus sp.]